MSHKAQKENVPGMSGPTDVKRRIRELTERTKQDKDVLIDVNGGGIRQTMAEANKLLGEVTKPKECHADAELFCMVTECALAGTMKQTQQQEGQMPMDFVRALRTMFVHTTRPQQDGRDNPAAFDWTALGEGVSSVFFAGAPDVSVMLGTLDASVKLRKATQRREKQRVGEVTRPDELDKVEESDKQETDRNMEVMWLLLRERQDGVPIAELTCNHDSYSQTVENMFTLAFLVKDNRVRLTHDQRLGLVAWPLGAKGRDKAEQGKGEKPHLQFIMTLHMDDWAVMKQLVARRDCVMPHRQAHDHCAAAAGPSGVPPQQQRPQAAAGAGAGAAAGHSHGHGKGQGGLGRDTASRKVKREPRSRSEAVSEDEEDGVMASDGEEEEEGMGGRGHGKGGKQKRRKSQQA